MAVEPNPHVSDEVLHPFLNPHFDPAEYLNATLPSLSITTPAPSQSDRASISDLATRTSTLLTTLNAQTSRLSAALTTLTDEIIRGGSRLAYEVEILRGETDGLTEVLATQLSTDLALFDSSGTDGGADAEPEHIQRLRTLTHVRARLDAVIRVFGDAMEWPLAPSELSSSLISVTAPDVGPEEVRDREEKGREAARKLRAEVVEMLEREDGVKAAEERVEELRKLAGVWKGTAEEKVRARHLDGLEKLVEEEQRKVARKSEGRRQAGGTVAQPAERRVPDAPRPAAEGSYGFMNSLRKMRGDIYIE
ncbi:hypothetical protein K461DRAFT_260624 [Myriangium duriaei CBS 260.36]|uniref:Uncharacterized protein n=1 Tax=Myriangium duriaei CBS 260.36 TaxID=1168546 RepID=A0A9P4ISN1_9PEZI|nr:hypothetical protein K461DRAFT_260624 [Myriangium duriaei CBS 260.36]